MVLTLQMTLGHEIGAGAACLKCKDKCEGFELHFWRFVKGFVNLTVTEKHFLHETISHKCNQTHWIPRNTFFYALVIFKL